MINAGLLLLVAWISQSVFNFTLSIGGWPQDGFSLEVVIAALLASVVLTIIQTAIGLLREGRPLTPESAHGRHAGRAAVRAPAAGVALGWVTVESAMSCA